MSKLEVDAIEPQSGTTLTLGASGDTVALSDNLLFNTASKGIYLGVTTATASNLLDDYEEGTWTAVVRGSSTAGTYEISANDCSYTKIGDFVHARLTFTFAGSLTGGGTGDFEIAGFPFIPPYSDVGEQAVSLYAITTVRTGTTFLRLRSTGRARLLSYNNAGGRTLEAISIASANGRVSAVINYKIT